MTDAMPRQHWMGLLARADAALLDELFSSLASKPDYSLLRPAEPGLVMVRGRAGGSGDAFNIGEIVVTRCSVQLGDGTLGHGYAAGRVQRKAEQAAVLDAMLQQGERTAELMARVIAPLQQRETRLQQERQAKSAATKVDFFTLVRGEDL